MAHNTTETDAYSANVVVPDEADDATALSVETAVQYLANRTKFVLAHLQSLSNFDNTTGSRVAAKGIKKVRRFTNVAAVQAVVGAAGIDGEFGWVDSTEGWYRFDNGSSTAADQFWVIAPSSGTGRWFRQDYLITNLAHGLPRLDATAKVAAAQLHNSIVSLTDPISDMNASINYATVGAAVTGTSQVDIGSSGDSPPHAATISGLAVGDILRLEGRIHAKFTAPAGVKAYLLVIAGATTVQVITINDVDDQIRSYQILTTLFVLTGTSVTIKIQGAVQTAGGSPSASLQAEAPFHIRATVIRP